MSEQQLNQQYNLIKAIFRHKLALRLGNKKIQSLHFRFPTLSQFRQKLREKLW